VKNQPIESITIMLQLTKSLQAWNSAEFKSTFIQQLSQLSLDELPLQQALLLGSYATKDKLQIMVNSMTEQQHSLLITTGIFYSSIIAGCNCSDDPTPVDLNSEYCEMLFTINKLTAETDIKII